MKIKKYDKWNGAHTRGQTLFRSVHHFGYSITIRPIKN